MFSRARASRPNTVPNLATHPSQNMTSLQFWKPGTAGPGSSLDRATQAEENVIQSAPSSGYYGIQGARERLPIFKHSALRLHRRRKALTNLLDSRGKVVVLRGEIWRGYCSRTDGMWKDHSCVLSPTSSHLADIPQNFRNIFTKPAGPRTEI